jgi:hypothetical protein
MDILISVLISSFMAWLAYTVVDELNKRDAKLELNPVVHACVAFLFGIIGMCFSAGYIAVKSYKLNK